MAGEAFRCAQRDFLPDLLERLGVYSCEQLPEFAQYIFDCCPFVNDPPGLQQIRSVKRLLHDSKGNCVDYSVAMAAASMVLGCGGKIRMVSYSYPGAFQHVFFIGSDGTIFDLVAGQKQDGTAKFQSDREIVLNFTPDYLYSYDVFI